MSKLADHLINMKKLISFCEEKYGRKPGSVQLLAASKRQPLHKIKEVHMAGQMAFGENYLQEALVKMAQLAPLRLEWHFIGAIQTNKTGKIAEHFAWVHGVDSKKIAKRLNDCRPSRLPPLNICIEVNVSDEANKAGVPVSEVIELAEYCQTLPALKLRGLMAIPLQTEHVGQQRTAFKQLSQLFQTMNQQGFGMDTLSMGMTDDFEAAIAEGSTLLRIGTGIFGNRL